MGCELGDLGQLAELFAPEECNSRGVRPKGGQTVPLALQSRSLPGAKWSEFGRRRFAFNASARLEGASHPL